MANQVALQTLAGPGEEVLCDAEAHIMLYELGAGAAYGGWQSRTWSPAGADIDTELVARMVRPGGNFQVKTKVIAVEQTHNMAAGAVIPLSTLERLRVIADANGSLLHCDGARLWNAHVATGVPLEVYGRLFDSISVCTSKGLGAPIGSLMIGTAERVANARTLRKRMGGGMRQVGMLAAAIDYALDHHITRLALDHERARRIAEAIGPAARWGGTNIIYIDCADAQTLVGAAAEQGVHIGAIGPRLARAITHLDVDDAAVDRVIAVLTRLLDVR
jgi:threonine aldolase